MDYLTIKICLDHFSALVNEYRTSLNFIYFVLFLTNTYYDIMNCNFFMICFQY